MLSSSADLLGLDLTGGSEFLKPCLCISIPFFHCPGACGGGCGGGGIGDGVPAFVSYLYICLNVSLVSTHERL